MISLLGRTAILTHEALERYRFRRGIDLEVCRKSLAARDYATIERVGHTLKGNGETFGYPELSLLGASLENSARRRDPAGIEGHLLALSHWISDHICRGGLGR